MQNFQRYMHTKKGKDDPGQIPLPTQMRMFIGIVRAMTSRENHRELISDMLSLSDSDTDVLIDFAKREEGLSAPSRVFITQSTADIREEYVDHASGAVDSVGAGIALNDMRSGIEQRENEHYRTLFSALSDEGERSLRRHLIENIAPNINSTEIDFAGMFAEAPEKYQEAIRTRLCSSPKPNNGENGND